MPTDYVFSLDQFNKDPFVQEHEKNSNWAISCDGLPIIKRNNIFYCEGFVIDFRWCKAI